MIHFQRSRVYTRMFRMKSKLYQTGTINSLMQAVYYGDTTVAELKQHGDFGLGTFDLVDGEMIVCDNVYYRADVNGKLSIAKDNLKSPFAAVTHFSEDVMQELSQHNFESFTQWLYQQFISHNLMYAIKVVGQFQSVYLRSESCQMKPFKKLSETLPKLQHEFLASDIDGILVGIWVPNYLKQVNVAGFHFHFIDEARKLGGHVFDFNLSNGHMILQTLKSIQVDCIDNEDFLNANLESHDKDSMEKVEKPS